MSDLRVCCAIFHTFWMSDHDTHHCNIVLPHWKSLILQDISSVSSLSQCARVRDEKYVLKYKYKAWKHEMTNSLTIKIFVVEIFDFFDNFRQLLQFWKKLFSPIFCCNLGQFYILTILTVFENMKTIQTIENLKSRQS